MLTTTPNWLKKKTEKGVVFKPNGQGANFGGQDDSKYEGANEPERGRVGRGSGTAQGRRGPAGQLAPFVRRTLLLAPQQRPCPEGPPNAKERDGQEGRDRGTPTKSRAWRAVSAPSRAQESRETLAFLVNG